MKKKKFLTAKELLILKNIGIVSLVGIGGYLVYKIGKTLTANIKDLFGKGESLTDLKDAVEKEQKRLKRLGEKLSYSEIQFRLFADTLHSSMQGFGTDEDKINAVLSKMKNDLDFSELIKTFGMKPYYITVRSLGLWKNMDLTSWIIEESRNAWTGNINKKDIEKYNKTLSSNGLTYKF